jgi:NTP pyrophosphatase (non-canonical NTP hydrolase)
MDIVQKMADKFEVDGLQLKVIEESSELIEVLIKRVTKSQDLKPPVEKVIEEMGDVIFRMAILAKKLGIEKDVAARIDEKSEQISKWFTGKYETESNGI